MNAFPNLGPMNGVGVPYGAGDAGIWQNVRTNEDWINEDWFNEDWAVILLDSEYPESQTLKSVLSAIGVQVFIGPHSVSAEVAPLILVHAWNRNDPDVAHRIEIARHTYPEAVVCYVTGRVGPARQHAVFDDARMALEAAGIGFICNEFAE